MNVSASLNVNFHPFQPEHTTDHPTYQTERSYLLSTTDCRQGVFDVCLYVYWLWVWNECSLVHDHSECSVDIIGNYHYRHRATRYIQWQQIKRSSNSMFNSVVSLLLFLWQYYSVYHKFTQCKLVKYLWCGWGEGLAALNIVQDVVSHVTATASNYLSQNLQW